MIKIIVILILILFIIYFLKNNNINENFNTTSNITDDERKIIKELSPHILAIKNLSDLASTLMEKNSLTVPGGLNINGEALINKLKIGKTYLRQDDEWLRLCSDYNNKESYEIGLIAARLASSIIYVNDDLFLSDLGSMKNTLIELKNSVNELKSSVNELKKSVSYLMTNAIRKDKPYAIQSSKGGHLSDQGGWKSAPQDWGGDETMYFREVPFNKDKY